MTSDDDLAYFNALDFLAKAQLVQNRMGSATKLGEVFAHAYARARTRTRERTQTEPIP